MMFMETGRSFFFLPFFLSRIVETSERRETDSADRGIRKRSQSTNTARRG